MERYSIEQRQLIVKIYYEHGEHLNVALYRKIREAFPRNQAPSETAVRKLIAKFKTHGSVADNRPKQYARSGRSEANIAAVQRSVENEPDISTRQRSQELGISRGTLRNIMRKDLNLPATAQKNTEELSQKDTVEKILKELAKKEKAQDTKLVNDVKPESENKQERLKRDASQTVVQEKNGTHEKQFEKSNKRRRIVKEPVKIHIMPS